MNYNFSANNENSGYNEENDIWYDDNSDVSLSSNEKKNKRILSLIDKSSQPEASSCKSLSKEPRGETPLLRNKLFPESDDQLLELLSPAMRKKNLWQSHDSSSLKPII